MRDKQRTGTVLCYSPGVRAALHELDGAHVAGRLCDRLC